MLIPLYLYSRGQLELPAFYLSDHFERRRETYYERLQAVTESGSFRSWLAFFLEGVSAQAEADRERIGRVRELHSQVRERLVSTLRSEGTLAIVDAVFVSPIFTAAQVRKLSGVGRAVAHRALRILESDGAIRVMKPGSGPRPSVWLYADLFEIVQ